MAAVLGAARAGEWWEHKLAPVAATGYAAAFLCGAGLLDAADTVLLVLAALLPGALFVSVLNDLTDRESDWIAGKPNRLAGRRSAPWWGVIAATVATGTAIGLLAWHDDLTALGLYAGAWLAFALYSVPPVRLKGRGAASVLADAAGAHVFPHLVMVAAVLGAEGRAFGSVFAVSVGLWTLAHGIRSALWHQLTDVEADTRSDLRTFGRGHPDASRRLGTYVAFPLEVVSFATALVVAGAPAALAVLPLYVVLELLRARRWSSAIVIVSPARSTAYRIAMNELYVAVYPLVFLLAAALREPADLLILAAHLAAFPRTLPRLATDVYDEVKRASLALVRG